MHGLFSSEAEGGEASLPDIDVEDFVRFCEYAYRGDYTVPLFRSDLGEAKEPGNDVRSISEKMTGRRTGEQPSGAYAAEQRPETTTWIPRWWWKKDDNVSPMTNRHILLERLYGHKYFLDGHPQSRIVAQCVPTGNNDPTEDFTPVFLAHAQLFRFAREKKVETLAALALYKLHRTLMEFKLYHNRVIDILELARYAYLKGRSSGGRMDELRKLVIEYIICKVDKIGKTKELSDLLREVGEFAVDYTELILQIM